MKQELLSFDHPAISLVRASCLLRELHQCTVTTVEELENG
nr:hypothetical protein [Kibdelosporangium sp. MJ126-NF4]CTQ91502.1 hypothetical protein [Kibdelosporangium sp. MJ126-NF4]